MIDLRKSLATAVESHAKVVKPIQTDNDGGNKDDVARSNERRPTTNG